LFLRGKTLRGPRGHNVSFPRLFPGQFLQGAGRNNLVSAADVCGRATMRHRMQWARVEAFCTAWYARFAEKGPAGTLALLPFRPTNGAAAVLTKLPDESIVGVD
jgi:hypothetical protein